MIDWPQAEHGSQSVYSKLSPKSLRGLIETIVRLCLFENQQRFDEYRHGETGTNLQSLTGDWTLKIPCV